MKKNNNSLSDWGDILARQGQKAQEEQDVRNRQMEMQMPSAIIALKANTNIELIQLFEQFTGGRNDIHETQMRAEFRDAIQTEILHRMGAAK